MIASRRDYQYYLDQDRKALGIKKSHGFLQRVKAVVAPNPILKWEHQLRRLEYLKNVEMKSKNSLRRIMGGAIYAIRKMEFRRNSTRLGFSISPNCFGPGLSIAHYGTIIVNEAARIGANCRLHACVNIGASGGSTKAPVIGDNVYIGPSAVIFGDIKIANNVTIGANATVNKSCDTENVILAGTPAKIVKEQVPKWIENR